MWLTESKREMAARNGKIETFFSPQSSFSFNGKYIQFWDAFNLIKLIVANAHATINAMNELKKYTQIMCVNRWILYGFDGNFPLRTSNRFHCAVCIKLSLYHHLLKMKWTKRTKKTRTQTTRCSRAEASTGGSSSSSTELRIHFFLFRTHWSLKWTPRTFSV